MVVEGGMAVEGGMVVWDMVAGRFVQGKVDWGRIVVDRPQKGRVGEDMLCMAEENKEVDFEVGKGRFGEDRSRKDKLNRELDFQ
jgi:hypothetical protein